MRKRLYSFLTALGLCLALLPMTVPQANAEFAQITDRSAIDGSDYTDSPVLAAKLNDIFDGNASIYRDRECTVPVDTALGTSSVRNNGISMFVEPIDGRASNIGTSCWIYANGVYYTLFGEATGNGIGENSDMLDLNGTGSRMLSYDNLLAWGVRNSVGTLIRASGHSMILLSYDAQGITVLDGNSNGRGLVAVTTRTWDRVGSYVEYIVQPKEDHYAKLYACGTCGQNSFWYLDQEGTLTISGSGSVSYPGWNSIARQVRNVVIEDGGLHLGDELFSGCTGLQQILFRGEAPTFSQRTLAGVSAQVCFPGAEASWTDALLTNHGGAPVWVPYGMTPLKITAQPALTQGLLRQDREVSIAAEGDGLSYQWYVKTSADALYLKTTCTDPVYRAQAGSNTDLLAICVVTDRYGNFLTSDSVLIPLCGEDHSTGCI